MAIRLKARSITPGNVRLASGVLTQLIAVANIVDGIGRGDGGIGTYPTTVASQAAQLIIDQTEVNSYLDHIEDGITVLAGAGEGSMLTNNVTRVGILGIKAV